MTYVLWAMAGIVVGAVIHAALHCTCVLRGHDPNYRGYCIRCGTRIVHRL